VGPANSNSLLDIRLYVECEACTYREGVWQESGAANSGSYVFMFLGIFLKAHINLI